MKKRIVWMDVLRLLCAFLVIVNHTNSLVFKASSPQSAAWWASIVMYVLCKVAVPIFVMISGACLLGRVDGWRKWLGRVLRMAAVLVLFSYLYFLYDAWVYWGLWPRMLRFDILLRQILAQDVTGSYWYLSFYLGLLLTLPLLQRLSCRLKASVIIALSVVCLVAGSLWVPYLAYTGLFFIGWLLRQCALPTRRWQRAALTACLCASAASVALLCLAYQPQGRYWQFMDDPAKPSLLVMTAAIAAVVLCRGLMERPFSQKMQSVWAELGACAFGVYLVQDWVIAQTEARLFDPLCGVITPFPASLVWEALVFAAALLAAWVMRRIPLLKKLV